MRNDPHIDLLALCRIKDLSWYLIAREASRTGGLAKLLGGQTFERSNESKDSSDPLREGLRRIDALRDEAAGILGGAEAAGFKITTVLDEDYPLNLRAIFNLPPFLFYRGSLDADRDASSIAVVGTRKPTGPGLVKARKMAGLLAQRGITVVSGLALGIDTAAHEAALAEKGRTVAVLGSGLHHIYPKENVKLAEHIAETGLLVSQFWPDTSPTSYTFPRRNVTMSGFSQGTVVIEASATSGAKMQARLALEHGKKVFLIKSLVTSQVWAQNYLKRGAIEISGVETIIERMFPPEKVRSYVKACEQMSLDDVMPAIAGGEPCP